MPIRTPGSTVSPQAEQAPEPAPQQEPEPASRQEPGRVAAGLFGAVTVVPALLAAAWLLPGLPLLLVGRLTAPPLVFMFSPLALGLCYLALRQQPARWPGFRAEAAPARKAVPWWAVAATVAVAAVFAVWQIAERTQQVIVLDDPATYLQTAAWIARHGSLPIPYSSEAFGGAHAGLTFASASYYPSGSGLSPAVMAGTPLVLAAAIWLAGVPAALVITPLTGACAVLSFGGLAGRLVGARWAPAAAAALALSLPEQYTSRGTFSEPLVQVLLFGGLCLLTDALLVPARPAAAARTLSSDPGQDRVLAALAGLVLGLAALVRVDGLSDILPAVPFLGLLLAARRRQGIPFALGLAAGAGYGLAGGYLLSRPYLDPVGPSLRPLGVITAVIVALTAIALGFPVQNQLRRLRASEKATTWLPPAAAALVLAAFAAFAVLPLLNHGLYDQSALVWVIWYLGLPAVLLGAAGLAVLASRGVKALLTWTDPGTQARTWALPLLIALWVIVTVLWRPAISPEQPWASRRLVPFVLPGLILGAIWATAWLSDIAGQRGRARATAGVVASCCVASLLIPATLTNLDLGSSPNASGSGTHLTANGMAFRRIGPGELAAVDRLCDAIGLNASVVILDSFTADRFAQVARGTCDTPTAILDHPTAETVGDALSGIERAGRRPVLIARDQSLLAPYGGGPRQVVSLLTTQEAHNLTAPATHTWPIRYTVWLSNPAGA
ncbi:MAG TPA: hypothetical protein VGS06_26410 [Streptosporangiaceae bacterium]|nr:hypothetical protein [Streptosporangiaceae bacterium]